MYSIGEISKMFQLPISTLRYYDKEGLFPHLKRVNGVRQFSESEIETLRVIDCLKKSGLEIKEIKEYMSLCSLGNKTLKQRKAIFEKQKEEVKPIIEHQEAKETHEEEIKEEEKQAEVSEEKEPQPEKLPSQIEVDFNDILNILVQAKRTVLNDIQDKWPVIRRYCYNLNTAKYANMLCDAKPVAAGEKGFILTLKYQPEVNNVNYTENYYPLKSFLKEVLGSDYDFIAVMEDEWPHMRQKFIQLNKEKKLPQPQPIVLHHIDEYHEPVVELTEAQQYAIDMFGDDIVEFEE